MRRGPVVVPKKKVQKKRVLRAIAKKEPKTFENTKTAMFVRGTTGSQTTVDLMKDLALLKKPYATSLKKKNNILPFEDAASLEFLSKANDCSLAVFASHSKKRPDNLVFTRFFDHLVLDMFEVGVEAFKSMSSFPAQSRPQVDNKPCFVFTGEEFEQKEDHKRFANLLLDFFRGTITKSINLAGLDHVIVCTSTPDRVLFRVYRTELKRSGSKIPHVELVEIGPSVDFVMRRNSLASDDLMKKACRIPQELYAPQRKVKNITKSKFNTTGRVHMGRQELSTLQLRKNPVLKRKRREEQ